jgi:hypothetical protein
MRRLKVEPWPLYSILSYLYSPFLFISSSDVTGLIHYIGSTSVCADRLVQQVWVCTSKYVRQMLALKSSSTPLAREVLPILCLVSCTYPLVLVNDQHCNCDLESGLDLQRKQTQPDCRNTFAHNKLNARLAKTTQTPGFREQTDQPGNQRFEALSLSCSK